MQASCCIPVIHIAVSVRVVGRQLRIGEEGNRLPVGADLRIAGTAIVLTVGGTLADQLKAMLCVPGIDISLRIGIVSSEQAVAGQDHGLPVGAELPVNRRAMLSARNRLGK